DNNVAGRTFNDEGIRRGHGDRPRGMTSGPYLADRGPGRLFAGRVFGTSIYRGERVDDPGSDLIAFARNSGRGTGEAGAHLDRREGRVRGNEEGCDPASMRGCAGSG